MVEKVRLEALVEGVVTAERRRKWVEVALRRGAMIAEVEREESHIRTAAVLEGVARTIVVVESPSYEGREL